MIKMGLPFYESKLQLELLVEQLEEQNFFN